MKRLLLLLILLITAFQGFSQTIGMSYQAVILNPVEQEIPGVNAQDNILANSALTIQFTVVNASGTVEYQEQHSTRTDKYGMINLLIGSGTPTNGNDFADIFWDGNSKKLKVGIDFAAGNNFSLLSEQNLTYVPQPPTEEVSREITGNSAAITALQNEQATQDGAIAEEVERATAAEEKLTIDLAAETTRAIATEEVLQGNIETVQINIDNNKTAIDAAIALKENSANKSTDVTLADNTNTNFPTEKAVKTYVDGKVSDLTTGSEGVQAELDATQTGAGLGADGTYTANTDSNFLKTATSLQDADGKLDAQVKTNADDIAASATNISANATDISTLDGKVTQNTSDISTNATNIALKENSANKSTDVTLADDTNTNFPTERAVKTYVDGKVSDLTTSSEGIQTELDATQTGAGLGTDGSYTANTESNFLKTATSLQDADQKLDYQVKTNAYDIAASATNISANATDISTLDSKVTQNTFDISTSATNIALKENSDNKSTDVTLADDTNTKFPTEKAVKTYVDGKVMGLTTGSEGIQTELDATQTGAGLETDGSYTANTESNFLKTATSLQDADQKLDAQVNTNATDISVNAGNINGLDTKVTQNTTDISVNASNIALKENSANKSTDVTLADETGNLFPTVKAVKTYVDGKEIDLTTNATGVLPIANGGTGSDTKNFVDLTTDQTIEGIKSFSQDLLVNGLTVGGATGRTLLGVNATGGSYSTVIGNNALAGSSYAVAIGRNANAGTSYSVAIGGLGATATTSYALAIGGNAPEATGVYSTAIGGNKPTATALQATAIGSSTIASGNNSSALGYGASVSDNNTIQLGNTSVIAIKTSGKFTTGEITLPNTDGIEGQVLSTNGSGIVDWVTPSTASSSEFVDLISNQIIGGDKSFSENISVKGVSMGSFEFLENVFLGVANFVHSPSRGNNNTVIGNYAFTSSAGNANTIIGSNAMRQGDGGSGDYNTAVGLRALSNAQAGNRNTGIGVSTMELAIGADNTALGYRAGLGLKTGERNTFLGSESNTPDETLTNATAIGYAAIVNLSNTIQLGNTEVTDLITSGKLTTGAITLPNTDGIEGQILSTNGSGVVNWVTASTAPGIREVADEFIAITSQTSFTLTETPSANSKVKMYINGIRISNTAYTESGSTLTYNPANNGAYTLVTGDRIQMDYYY